MSATMLKIGDRLGALSGDRIIAVHTISRTTKTQAIAKTVDGPVRFCLYPTVGTSTYRRKPGPGRYQIDEWILLSESPVPLSNEYTG